jgi:hypothetical protein
MILLVITIYNNPSNDITNGSTLYYSPRSMIPKGSEPSWDFSKLTEVKIDGVRSEYVRFYIEH